MRRLKPADFETPAPTAGFSRPLSVARGFIPGPVDDGFSADRGDRVAPAVSPLRGFVDFLGSRVPRAFARG